MVLLTKGRTVDESRTELSRQHIRGGSKFVIHPYPEYQTYEHTGRLYILGSQWYSYWVGSEWKIPVLPWQCMLCSVSCMQCPKTRWNEIHFYCTASLLKYVSFETCRTWNIWMFPITNDSAHSECKTCLVKPASVCILHFIAGHMSRMSHDWHL